MKTTALALLIAATACTASDPPGPTTAPGLRCAPGPCGRCVCIGDAPPGRLDVLAGAPGGDGYLDGRGDAARLYDPLGIAYADGALYVLDAATLRRIDSSTGEVTTLLGADKRLATRSWAFDAYAYSIVTDGAHSLFIADGDRVLHVALPSNLVTPLAVDFQDIVGLAYDPAGALWVRDDRGHRISRLALDTLAVTPLTTALPDDGAWLALDGGALYVASTGQKVVLKVALPGGEVSVLAGASTQGGDTDGVGAAARFYMPTALIGRGDGTLYVTDLHSGSVRRIALATAEVTTVAGTDTFPAPVGGALDGAGRLFVADGLGTVSQISLATSAVTQLAGSPVHHGETDGTGAAARFDRPQALVFDGNHGVAWVADAVNGMVRGIDVARGAVSTLTDRGARGRGAPLHFDDPSGLALDGAGHLFVAEAGSRRIDRVDVASGALVRFAGSDELGPPVDGAGSAARFYDLHGLTIDGPALFVLDGSSVRRIDLATAAVTTLAGKAGFQGATDGVGAAARFYDPNQMAADGHGHLYVSERLAATVRKIDVADGTVSTLAGVYRDRGFVDGVGAAARFGAPGGIVVEPQGSLLVADGQLVRRIDPTSGAVTTAVGQPGRDQRGVRPGPLPANLNEAGPLSLAPDGALLIGDLTENAILIARFYSHID
jgi:DNA-binding beta-propeller fold protein YncE